MAEALKKRLDALHINPGDLVLFRVPLGAPDSDWLPFVNEVNRQLSEAHGNRTTVLAVRPGFSFETVDLDTMERLGFIHILPETVESEERLAINWDLYEATAIETVRRVYASAREQWEAMKKELADVANREAETPCATCGQPRHEHEFDEESQQWERGEDWSAHVFEPVEAASAD